MSNDNREFRDYYHEGNHIVFTGRYLADRGTCCQSVCRHCPWRYGRPERSAKIISMVPSWTETLIFSGVDVVGRTRYCIHPKQEVRDISVVGGTKSFSFHPSIDADYILLDREENTKQMADTSPVPVLVTHVESIGKMPDQLRQLNLVLKNKTVEELAIRWQDVLQKELEIEFPPVLEWGRKGDFERVVYVIWKDPWMCVSSDTFIGSVIEKLGFSTLKLDDRYAEIDLSKYDSEENLILFSSEPYPFLKKKSEIELQRASYAFVDGESYSWFGLRTLEFLESLD